MRWERVEQLAERAPSVEDLRFHRLELVAARRLRERGAPVPAQLAAAELEAAVIALAAPVVLRRARAAYDGPMALMKGPEVAMHYPDPLLRPYGDLDLLVADAPAAHRALLEAGFVAAGAWAGVDYHLQPLCWPGLPLAVELHSAVHFPDRLRSPATAELLAGRVPARFAGGAVDTLAPAAHAIVVAAHAWAHTPLGHLGQLVDTALLAREADPAQLDALARRWGCARLWRTTRAAIRSLDGAATAPVVRVIAPHLRTARERSLLGFHVEELVSPLFGLPPAQAARQVARMLGDRFSPAADETWGTRIASTRRAWRHARLRHSEHAARLGAPLPDPKVRR